MEPRRWLISRNSDFWFASAGASGGLLAAMLWIVLHGDREFDWLDLVFSELHLGATYDAVIRRRLWRRLPGDVLIAPLVILALVFALITTGRLVLVTSITLYVAIWHRGRQNFGLARFYQRLSGGPVSRQHRWLFSGAIYTPMVAALFLYGHLDPTEYEGQAYSGLDAGGTIAWGLGLIALGWVLAYLYWTWRQTRRIPSLTAVEAAQNPPVHPGECWIVMAHVVAFGSAYVLGPAQTSFLLVLTVHHELQYLYFTYAIARWPVRAGQQQLFPKKDRNGELRFALSFAVWPVIGLAGALGSGWYQAQWLASLGVGGLFCHYWLDGRIWTRRAIAG